jgi:hypothetical protein
MVPVWFQADLGMRRPTAASIGNAIQLARSAERLNRLGEREHHQLPRLLAVERNRGSNQQDDRIAHERIS